MRATTAALLLLLALSTAVAAQDNEALRSKITAMENAWNLAEENKDVKALTELLANSLVYVDHDGTVLNKENFLQNVKRPSAHPQQFVNEAMQVYVYGSAAVATGTYREKGVEKDRPYTRRVRFTDTWVQQNGVWQCVAGQLTLVSH